MIAAIRTPSSFRSIAVSIFVGACVCFLQSSSWAVIPPTILARGKAATAYIFTSEGSGSAFCIDPVGVFVTNAHVVEGVDPGESVNLVIRPSQQDQETVKGTVIYVDKKEDLAFVQAGATEQAFEALTLGDDSGLEETADIVAFGFPFGSALAWGSKYPGITVSTGRITALRRDNGRIERIQFDASVNPGNSGGPIVDAQGNVVGIVVSGVPGSGINFAIPVSRLCAYKSRTEISLDMPQFHLGHQHDVQMVRICVLNLNRNIPVTLVDVAFSTIGDVSHPVVAAQVGNGIYEVQRAPIAAGDDSARNVQVSVTAHDGTLLLAKKTLAVPVRVAKRVTALAPSVFPVPRAERDFLAILPFLKKQGKPIQGDIEKFLDIASEYSLMDVQIGKASDYEEARELKHFYFGIAAACAGLDSANTDASTATFEQKIVLDMPKNQLVPKIPAISAFIDHFRQVTELHLISQKYGGGDVRINNQFCWSRGKHCEASPSAVMALTPSGVWKAPVNYAALADQLQIKKSEFQTLVREFQKLNVAAVVRTEDHGTEVVQIGLVTREAGLLFQDIGMQPPKVSDTEMTGKKYTIVDLVSPRIYYYETK